MSHARGEHLEKCIKKIVLDLFYKLPICLRTILLFLQLGFSTCLGYHCFIPITHNTTRYVADMCRGQDFLIPTRKCNALENFKILTLEFLHLNYSYNKIRCI